MVKIKKDKSKILLTIFFFIIIIIAILVKVKGILLIDKIGYLFFVKTLRNSNLTVFMKLITKLCNYKFIITLTAFFMIYFLSIQKKINTSLIIFFNNGISVLINTIIKYLIKRPRPTYRLIKIGGYSFPSGHAMMSISFYGLLAYLAYKYINNKILRNIVVSLNILLILLIGISRIYLGVHYTSDVLVGYLTSTITLIILIKVINKYKLIP